MKRIFIILSFVFLAYGRKHHVIKNWKPHSNQVNLSLETAFVFDPKDANYDISLIKTLRSFLDSLQTAIVEKQKQMDMPAIIRNRKEFHLSDFFYDLGLHITNYADEDVKRFAVALQAVVEDYYPSGTAYHKIIFDPRLKAFIKNTLSEWAVTDPKVLKEGIKTMYWGPTYDNTFIDFVQVLNQFYDDEDRKNLEKYANKFKVFPNSQKKLETLIDKVLNVIVFNKYEQLNFVNKNLLVSGLSKVADYVGTAFKNRSADPEAYMRARQIENSSSTTQKSIDDMTVSILVTDQEARNETETGIDAEGENEALQNNSPEKRDNNLEVNTINENINNIHKEIVLNKMLNVRRLTA